MTITIESWTIPMALSAFLLMVAANEYRLHGGKDIAVGLFMLLCIVVIGFVWLFYVLLCEAVK